MDVEKADQPRRAFSTIAPEEEEGEGVLLKERHAREMAAVRKLTSPCLQRVEAALESNTYVVKFIHTSMSSTVCC